MFKNDARTSELRGLIINITTINITLTIKRRAYVGETRENMK